MKRDSEVASAKASHFNTFSGRVGSIGKDSQKRELSAIKL